MTDLRLPAHIREDPPATPWDIPPPRRSGGGTGDIPPRRRGAARPLHRRDAARYRPRYVRRPSRPLADLTAHRRREVVVFRRYWGMCRAHSATSSRGSGSGARRQIGR